MNILEIAKYQGVGVLGSNDEPDEPIELIFYEGKSQLDDFAKAIAEQSLADFKSKCEFRSGYCLACNKTGLSHCRDPINCGQVVNLYTLPID